ncbi:MAG: hypothetical protein ACI9VR_000416 [Cognaticolwellia sp.]|jgi:hypothetical protein
MVQVVLRFGSSARILHWYGEDGQVLGGTGGGHSYYCCDGQGEDTTPFSTWGVPMQTCYAPIPYRTPEMERPGECVDPPGSCSALGTRSK